MGYSTHISDELEATLLEAGYRHPASDATYADVLDWLREKYQVDICSFVSATIPGKPTWYRIYATQLGRPAGQSVIWNPLTQLRNPEEWYQTLPQAFEVAIPAVLLVLKLISLPPTL